MQISVVALGKIGLPLAVQFASKGHQVVGVDIDSTVVSAVNSGESPFPGEAGLEETLKTCVSNRTLRATTDYADAIPESDVVVVVVPLLVDAQDGAPRFGPLDTATQSIADSLTSGTLLIYETTLPIGTTRARWLPFLERASGLREGSDFHLVFSPERVYSGRIFADLRRYPKLVGALSEAGSDAARQFYDAVLDFDDRSDLDRPNGVWDMGSPEAAEMSKLVETTYRDVNIALVNEFARFAATHDIDIRSLISACNSQPFSHLHTPGISVGGHCIPVYPRLYLWTDPGASVVTAARATNDAMPIFAVDRLATALGRLEGQSIAILGLAYRGGVREDAFSGAYTLRDELLRRGAYPLLQDPLYSDTDIRTRGFVPYDSSRPVSGAIVHTDHEAYRTLSATEVPGVRAVFDGRRILQRHLWPGVDLLEL